MFEKLCLVLALSLPAAVLAQNRTGPAMPTLPSTFEASDYSIRVSAVAEGLVNPWSIAFLPNADMLVTERPGRLRIIRDGELDPDPISGTPDVHVTVLGGLLDVLLHPEFAQNDLIYLSYSKAVDESHSTTAVARARLDGMRLRGLEEIFVANLRSTSVTNFGGRMAFGRDGKLYLTVGERQEQERAQDTMDHGGKVLRLNDDGTAPADNPFYGRDGWLPEIYTLGHRSPQGLGVHPQTGQLWENEHGPLGGDEINVLEPGANYGWPIVSYGRDYDGTQITDTGLSEAQGLVGPFMYWMPSIAISGMSFYTGDAFPLWQGNAFVGSMMTGRIRWTGHVERLTFNEAGHPITREPLLGDLRQRIRDVRPGPDGLIYVLTDENPGFVLRLEPIAER
jgi:glucose/arabinose dehydrogenase